MIENRNILLISPEPWSHIFVSKHHYAVHLAERGNKVFFLNPPTNTPLIGLSKTGLENLYILDYDGFIKGLRYLPPFLQRVLIKKKFQQLQKAVGKAFDFVWSFDNSVFYDFGALPEYVVKISHIVDLNQDFETAKAAQTADICFGTTQYIVDRLKTYNLNTHFINHGYCNTIKTSKKIELSGKNKIKALYAGNLDIPYLDWSLLTKLVDQHPEIDFLFVGNKTKDHKLFKASNVYYEGVIPSDQLPDYYSCVDILLICYKAEEYLEQLANPHKMMGYLGAGKVIIATKTTEYQHIADSKMIAMSDNNDGYSRLFERVINSLDEWNSIEKRKKRQEYAKMNSYPNQIKKIERLINAKL